MVEHTCELFLKRESKIPFVTIEPLTFKNVWKTWCSISKYTPKCDRFMDSRAAVAIERRRHAGFKHWWIIHPFSYVRYLLIIYTDLYIYIFIYLFLLEIQKQIFISKKFTDIFGIC